MENCTLGAGNEGNCSLYLIGDAYCRLVQTIFLSPVWISNSNYSSPKNTPSTNCIFAVANASTDYPYSEYIGPGSMLVTDASQRVFDGYTPVIGANAAVDAGDVSMNIDADGKDVYGNQRVYNGQIDIGAVEADWRPNYTVDIARKGGIVVAEASPGVYEVTNGTARVVRLTEDSDMEIVFNNSLRSRYATNVLTLSMPANSSAVVTVDGMEEAAYAAGDAAETYEYKFIGHAGSVASVRVDCTSGSVDVVAANRLFGMVTIFK